jgi:hypothetical protein
MPWDPLVPAERVIQNGLSHLPPWASRWLGYRGGKNLAPSPSWMVCLYGFIGAFGGLSIIIAIFAHTDYFTIRMVPPIVASFVSHTILSCVQQYAKFVIGCFCNSLLWSY